MSSAVLACGTQRVLRGGKQEPTRPQVGTDGNGQERKTQHWARVGNYGLVQGNCGHTTAIAVRAETHNCNNRIKWRWSPKILTATHFVIYRRPQLNSYFFCVFLGIDAPLVPLRQSDMCLVCIAFASWVLKSASPQGADTWKAGMCFHCKYTCFKPQPHLMFILDVYWNLSVASKVI